MAHGFKIADACVQVFIIQYKKIIAVYNSGCRGINRGVYRGLVMCAAGIYHLRSFIFAPQTKNYMTYNVQIKVMLLKDLLDPQGKAVQAGMGNLGFNNVNDVRIGKHITLSIDSDSEEKAKAVADEAAKKLLANPVMEYYEIEMVN